MAKRKTELERMLENIKDEKSDVGSMFDSYSNAIEFIYSHNLMSEFLTFEADKAMKEVNSRTTGD